MDCEGVAFLACKIGGAVRLLGWDMEGSKAVVAQTGTYIIFVYEWVVHILGNYGKEIIGIFGGAYGILKWWYYRESVLHQRLERYLDKQDDRLADARKEVLYALARPGSKRRFSEPLFAVRSLRKVLTSRGLVSRWSVGKPESSALRSLRKAEREISRRMETLVRTRESFEKQLATAYLLKGAVQTSNWDSRPDSQRDTKALQEFQAALRIPGPDHQIQAKELEAHELRKLGMLDAAGVAYDELYTLSQTHLTGKEREMMCARARYWRAVIYQAVRWFDGTDGSGAANANNAIKEAISLRRPYVPFFLGWEAITQGDMEYFRAFAACNLGFVQVEADALNAAKEAYEKALPASKASTWTLNLRGRLLRRATASGLERVRIAQRGGPDAYDHAWLLPPQALREPQ